MLTHEDKELLAKKGISEEKIAEQLACFEKGFPFLKLSAAASVENGGIMKADEKECEQYLAAWDAYKAGDKKIVKFVPASGAASRMFKNMFEFLGAEYDKPTTDFEKKFFDHIHDFAFYNDLNAACLDNTGKNINALLSEHNYKAVVSNLLESAGLNYGALPKGLLKFHRYADGVRTPLEEHLVEGALYAAGKTGEVNVHFTVSTEHRALFEKLVAAKAAEYEAKYGTTYHISFSEQKPSTDTVAADMENKPFRDKDGKLLFRPGGHGALIENLNDLDADIVFIKNIDNVVPDRLKADTVTYKKLLAGVLVTLQKQAFEYRFRWNEVPYEPGELKAVAYKDGKVWAEASVKTTGTPVKLKLTPDKKILKSDGEDLIFVRVSVLDADGNEVPTAEPLIKATLDGPSKIVATDNGDPTCLIPFPETTRPAFNGLYLAIVKADRGAKGKLHFSVESDGLGTAEMVFQIEKGKIRQYQYIP